MTDGTSQGLFIVVAIVIFGIFVVMAYILFEDTLSPSLANMFTEAIEQSENSLSKWEISHTDSDFSLWGTSMYQAREGTNVVLDTDVKQDGNPTLKVNFGFSSEGDRGGTKDFVIWLDNSFPFLTEGDKVQISYYIRADNESEIGTRIGGRLYGGRFNSKVTDEWQKVTITDSITGSDTPYIPAVVFYSNTPDTFWVSDITVKTRK